MDEFFYICAKIMAGQAMSKPLYKMNQIIKHIFCFLCLLLVGMHGEAGAERVHSPSGSSSLYFESSQVLRRLPNKEVQAVYQDREGYLWICTRNGLFRYDGYALVAYKSNFAHPDLLTNNNIFCVAEDRNHRLWIGTYRGLNVLDKRTDMVRKFTNAPFSSTGVSQILVTSDNRVWIGTEWGLYEYDESRDDFSALDSLMTGDGRYSVAIKSLMEDDRGDIWIGTWNSGLYRYERATGRYIAYPQMNPRNSAHVLFQDSRKNIWVGTWGCGLQLLHNAYEPSRTTWTTFSTSETDAHSISDNIIYSMTEDESTGSLWVGTRRGLSVLSLKNVVSPPPRYCLEYVRSLFFENYRFTDVYNSLAGGEVSSLSRDLQGNLWIGMIGGGVQFVNPHKVRFKLNRLPQMARWVGSNSIRSLMADNQDILWIGTSTDGFGMLNRATGQFTYYKQWVEFGDRYKLPSVMCFMQSPSTGHIWMGVYNNGVYEIDMSAPPGKKVTHYTREAWVGDGCIYGLLEDEERNLWLASRTGVFVRMSDGRSFQLDFSKVLPKDDAMFAQLIQGNGDEKWIASGTDGVLRVSGKGDSAAAYQVSAYSVDNGKLNNDNVNCVFRDSQGRIWAGTNGSGLNLFSEEKDSFIPVHLDWNLPGDAVVGMLEDEFGHLWLATNAGLVELWVSDSRQYVRSRLYTLSDGLQDNLFNRGAVTLAPDGEMFFGGHYGYNSFHPSLSREEAFSSPVVLTDIKIFNRSWIDLPEKERCAISENAPCMAQRLRLDHWHNNFTIEFATLEYTSPERNRYAYRLEGFDAEWQYTDASRRFAYYNNLKPGHYLFQVKASSSDGIWGNQVTELHVDILTPPWATWWARTSYVLFLALIGYWIFRVTRNRFRLREALRMQEMEKEKADELNHVKLQFFTNITHELLTPLTILSASVDELKRMAPAYQEQYSVMVGNINRLIRLLQQILEFRKAETGNLKLRVSEGDLAAFVRACVDSFQPLMKKRNIAFEVSCLPEPFPAYFDTDKLDKIVYNLLSNVAKYSHAGETVVIRLEQPDEYVARLVVKDNGPGISKEAQKSLFKRFYEGDYRRFKTTGTGIGLSLVHDLVKLHHGTIRVESEEGKGTAFMITIPTVREGYAAEEIDKEVPAIETDENPLLPSVEVGAEDEMAEPEADKAERKLWKVLLVEDSEDLLQLMVRLLSPFYHVAAAKTGKEALAVIEHEPVDLVVSDVMMPEMDGIALCRAIKDNPSTAHIPVILLTVKHEEKDRIEAYDSGADGFIVKPFSTSVLLARIANLLRDHQRWMEDFKKQLFMETKGANYTSQDEDFLHLAIDCVNRHLADTEFDLPQFLDEMHTTKTTCFRKLKTLTGMTFVSFVRSIRMKAACRIMEEKKNIRISELAYSVGYNDPRYFSSSFKKEIGLSPSEYMEQRQK